MSARRLLSSLIVTSLLLPAAVTGCVDIPRETEQTVPEAVPVASDGDFKIGAIYSGNKRETEGFTAMHHEALMAAAQTLGVSSYRIIDDVSDDPDNEEEVREAVEELVASGCDIIFDIDFDHMYAFAEAAEEYPEVVFCQYGGYLCNDTNFINYTGRTYQAYYLAGIAAGFYSISAENDYLGYIRVENEGISQLNAELNAYTLGARAVNPNAAVYLESIDEHTGAEAVEEARNHLSQSIHCDYIFDMSAPDTLLTYPVVDLQSFYEQAIETSMNESSASEFVTNMGGNFYGGLYDGFITMSELNGGDNLQISQAIGLTTDLFYSGQFDVFSGTKLSFTQEDTQVSVDLVASDLIDTENSVVVEAGEPSLYDSVIRAYTDFFVLGVTDLS